MSNDINFESISFNIISKVGQAKYLAVDAFKKAKNNDFIESYKLIDDANKLITEAAKEHMVVIQKEAEGNKIDFSVLFMHAEDQFLTTQTFILSTKMQIETLEMFKNGK